MTDEDGKTVEEYEYDSFGNLKRHGNKVKNTFTYTGREYDKETGLYYYRNRYYDPKTGRFLTQDPLGMIDGPNLYTYVNNNPVNFIDPWGLSKQKQNKPWWQKLEEGYYYGTGYGEESLEWYIQRWLETGEWYYALGGNISALWVPETYQKTGWTFVGAGSLAEWAAKTGPWVGTGGIHPPHHGMGRHLELILKAGEKVLKVFIPGKDRWIYWFFK